MEIGDNIFLEEKGQKYYGKVVKTDTKYIYATMGDSTPIKFERGILTKTK